MRRLGHLPALDGLRGIAIALVLLHHTVTFAPSAFLGVQGFFVLSGFLITTLLLEEYAAAGAVSLRAFYRRRALRLFPALWTAMAGYLILAAATQKPGLIEALRGVGFGLAYATNIVESLSPTLVPVSIGHLWSLATEEQFYLLWPPLLIVALRARIQPRTILIVLVAFAAAVVANRATLTVLDFGWRRVYYAPDTTFDAILIGCAAAIGVSSGLVSPSPRFLKAGRVACFFLLPVLLFVPDRLTYLGGMLLFELGFVAVILSVVLGSDSELSEMLAARPLRLLGRVSYGVYLWDWIIQRETSIGSVAAAVMSIAVAAASYQLVELPFLRRKRKPATVELAPQPSPA